LAIPKDSIINYETPSSPTSSCWWYMLGDELAKAKDILKSTGHEVSVSFSILK